jgi:hypothetical protein
MQHEVYQINLLLIGKRILFELSTKLLHKRITMNLYRPLDPIGPGLMDPRRSQVPSRDPKFGDCISVLYFLESYATCPIYTCFLWALGGV